MIDRFEHIPGWSTPEMQGELIKHLISKLNRNQKIKIAEVGVYMGRCTSIWNAELIRSKVNYEYQAIDHFKGSSEHIASDNRPNYEQALEYLNPILKHINVIKNDSLSACIQFPDEYFDIVYIDASHEYEFVKQDIEAWLPKVKTDGWICGDDYHPIWYGVVDAVNEKFKNNHYIIGNTQWIYHKNENNIISPKL